LLLVDDDPIVINTLHAGLTSAGYHVDGFLDGASALAQFETKTPDLAVVDVVLPDIPGTELAARMMETCCRPIIILSGHSDLEIVNQAIGYGVVGYLVKPISVAQLIPSVETALARFGDITQQVAKHFGGPGFDNNHIKAVLERFSGGLVIVDGQRNVIHQNHVAKSLIDKKTVLVNRGGCLHAAGNHRSDEFNHVIDCALGGNGNPHVGAVALDDESGRGVQVWAAPLGDSGSGASTSAIVIIIDPNQPTPAPEPLLKALYGLTTKECCLVSALLNGQTIDQYCESCHVSANTVRTHLKSIYRKTNTNRQVDLVRLLSRLFANLSPTVDTQ
jgi:DNA-binding NarL/FixJ family response regulator